MKPFDIDLVRKGMPVVTRDGRPVTILATDLQGTDRPIVAAISESRNGAIYNYVLQYFIDGRLVKRWVPTQDCNRRLLVEDRPDDLMME